MEIFVSFLSRLYVDACLFFSGRSILCASRVMRHKRDGKLLVSCPRRDQVDFSPTKMSSSTILRAGAAGNLKHNIGKEGINTYFLSLDIIIEAGGERITYKKWEGEAGLLCAVHCGNC